MEIKCRVLSHSTGPECVECNKKMDAITIEDKNHRFFREEAYYCYFCTFTTVK